MIINILTLTFISIKLSKCSDVMDAQSQDTIYVSEYCPRQKYCSDGTHVMCMYYDHDHEFGPRCGNPMRTEVTPKMVQTILQNVNNIRGKVASGIERGKNDEILPRAYGMMKMEWDRELATLAQVLANQCLGGKEDVCRATERFPKPSQSIAIIHFKYPNWEYIRHNNTEKGLNEEKLTYSMDRFLKSAHVLKRTVTKDIINECPPFKELPDLNMKYYLNLIRGEATHIGCGLSAYSKYKLDGQTESIQNSVQVVCNISEGPQPGEPLYNTEPPIPGQGLTKRCGCPRGSKETRNCLCERVSDNWTISTVHPTTPRDNTPTLLIRNKKQTDQNYITKSFQPHWEYKKQNYLEDYSKSKSIENPTVEDSDDHFEGKMVKQAVYTINDTPVVDTTKSRNGETHSLRADNFSLKKENDYEPKYTIRKKTDDSNESLQQLTTKSATPKKKYTMPKPNYQKDITFRKHPSIISISKSQDRRQEIIRPLSNIVDDEPMGNIFEEITTESALNLAEDKFVVNYQNKKQNYYSSKIVKEMKDAKRLHNILNMLEQEVKIIDFDINLKDFFDLKMQKIYKSVVNRDLNPSSMKPSFKKQTESVVNTLRNTKYPDSNYNIIDADDKIQVMKETMKTDNILEQSTRADKTYRDTRNQGDNIDNTNHNYDYADNKYEENPIETQKYIKSEVDNAYEDNVDSDPRNIYKISQKQWLKKYQNNDFKYKDILTGKYSIDREYDEANAIPEIRNQETLLANNSGDVMKKGPKFFIDDLNPDELLDIINSRRQDMPERKNIRISIYENERPLAEDNDVDKYERRSTKFQERNPQFTSLQQTQFDRQNKNEDRRKMLLLRPQIIEKATYRTKITDQRPPEYQSESDVFDNNK